ncbi:MAG: efflux RND transporter permease subunit, partial [Phycisphaerae bacterium]
QFRSYIQPLVVLLAIVFGLVGMVMGLVVNRYPFTTVTAVAMVGLCGIVVNDALVLLDFINKERARGSAVVQALHVACRKRARPILLTTVTTIFGLGPMALGIGGYSKIWSPFAMSMCWGLGVATALTLLLVPACYLITEDLKRLVGLDAEASAPSVPSPTGSAG